ncbi:hypothetical protein [Mesobacillus jeotgali]|uniref:hypothetical protein n=1 Tax=Mesobacillus jeotgali TaxID=129985 RepID=UPI001CFD11FB|nr:hypothetical protein [Mesobacillus jeotgali]
MIQITKRHLEFVEATRDIFSEDPIRETRRNGDDTLIALRMGMDRDCVEVWELGGKIANFVQQMEPCPKPRKAVQEFAHDMEKQLKVNDHKGGWGREHHEYLRNQMGKNYAKLVEELCKEDKDKYEITIRCANIANFAMMIADNEGEHL